MSSLRFASPWWLLALLLVAAWAWLRGRRGSAAALSFPSTQLLGAMPRPTRTRPGRWLAALRLLALALVVIAIARPQVEKSENREEQRGINLMLTVDFSGTMRTRDFFLDGRRVTRSEGLKSVGAEFIRDRTNDRIGLVRFDRDAHLASPLTLDHAWLLERLREEDNGTGTAIGTALAVAAHHLQRHTNETRVIVLMTDAENLSSGLSPEEVIEAVRPLGIRLHCIQLVSGEAGPFLYGDDLAQYLTRCSVRTGGEFFRVRDGADLRTVYARIDTLEKQKLRDRGQKSWRELFPWTATPALLLVLVELVLAHTVWRRLP